MVWGTGRGVMVTVLVLGLVATSTAAAQVPGPTMDDGTYTGVISLGGSFGFGIDQDGTTGQITWSGQGRGPATLVIDGGAASGTWALSGGGTITGSFAAQGQTAATISGTQDVLEAQGTFTGDSGAYRMVGTSDQVVTATVEVPVIGSRSSTQRSTDPVDAPLHDLLFTCSTLTGRYDHDIRQDLEAIGFHESIVGSVALVREPHSDETLDALDALGDTLQQALTGIHATDDVMRMGAIGQLAETIRGAAEVAMTLNGPSPCPASGQDYLELAAGIVRQAVEALLAIDGRGEVDIPVSVWWDAVTAITATGLAATPEGDDLLQAARAAIEDHWTDLVTDPDTDVITPDPQIVEIVVMSALYVWDLPVGDERIAASDLMLVYRE